jgi:hypothetical protein
VIELIRTIGVLPMASRILSQIVWPGGFDTGRSYPYMKKGAVTPRPFPGHTRI